MTEYEITTLSLIAKPKGDPIYSDHATIVEMMDEVGGPFVRILQHSEDNERGEIRIDLDGWGAIKEAADTMLAVCKSQQETMNTKEGTAK
jgi:hypothetical protein